MGEAGALKIGTYCSDLEAVVRAGGGVRLGLLSVLGGLAMLLAGSGCGGPSATTGLSAPITPCSMLSTCEAEMTTVAGEHVLLPHSSALKLVGGWVGTTNKKDDSGMVGKLSFEESASSPPILFNVYKAGQVAGLDLTLCPASGNWSILRSPQGRQVCWSETASGIYESRYLAGPLLYEVSSYHLKVWSAATPAQDQAWAERLIDSFS